MGFTITGGVSISGGVSLSPPPSGPVNYDGNLNFGSKTVLDNTVAGYSNGFSSAWDTINSKLIVAYANYDGDAVGGALTEGYISIGSVTGDSVSYGSAVQFSDQATYGQIQEVAVCYDSNAQKGVVVWEGNSAGTNDPGVWARTITVTGTTCTLGSVNLIITKTETDFLRAVYDSTNNKVVVAFKCKFRVGVSDDHDGYSFVGTVSGTNISFGSLVKFTTNKVYDMDACFDSTNGKVVVAYNDFTNYAGRAQVGTVSGTSISWGSQVVLETGQTKNLATVYDSTEQRVVVMYRDGTDNLGKSKVGEVSGSSITFGSAVTFNTDTYGQYHTSAYEPISKKVVTTYMQSDKGKCVVGTVSGSSISFLPIVDLGGSEVDLQGWNTTCAVGGSASIHVAFKNGSNSSKSTGVVATIS